MNKLYILIIISLVLTSSSNASAPFYISEGSEAPKRVTGNSLTILFDQSVDRPQYMSWIDGYGTGFENTSNSSKLIIPRIGMGAIPGKLFLIPQNSKLRPTQITISPETKNINLHFDTIKNDEIWLWTKSIDNPCKGFDLREQGLKLELNLLMKKNKTLHSFGKVAWKIKKINNAHPQLLNIDPQYFNTVENIKIKNLTKGSAIHQAKCITYYGGKCPFLYQITEDSWGKIYLIEVFKNAKFIAANCPV